MLKLCDHQASFCDPGIVVSGSGGSGDSRVRARLVALQVAAGADSQFRGGSAGEQPGELAVAAPGDGCGEPNAGSRGVEVLRRTGSPGRHVIRILMGSLEAPEKVYEQRS